jgi:hypothetical protein
MTAKMNFKIKFKYFFIPGNISKLKGSLFLPDAKILLSPHA